MMYKKLMFLTFLVLLLALAGNASAATCWFYGGGSTTGDWDVSGNWWGGEPTSADTAIINEGGIACVVDSSQMAVCNRLALPDWQNGTEACILNMTGGTITVGSGGNFEMGRWWGGGAPNDIGQLDLSGGTITVGGYMHVGEDGQATINMTGGIIDIAGAFEVPESAGSGTGTVSLDGGTIETASIAMDADGSLDVQGGTLIIDGDVSSTINGYVTSGYITAYDGNGTVYVDYDVNNPGQTTVRGGRDTWFNPDVNTGRWDDADDWWPHAPKTMDEACHNKAGKTCVIDSNNVGGNAAVCKSLWLPIWMENGPGTCYLNMTGGSLTVSDNFEMGAWASQGDDGQLDISGGAISVGVDLYVGSKAPAASAGGTGTINITGGTIDIAGAFKVPSGDAGTSGTVNLDAGTIEAGSITMDANGSLDIEGGTLIIDGDVTSTVNGYVTNGYITAYDGNGTVGVDYDNTNPGQTTVTGSEGGEPELGKATNPSPADSATNVDVNDNLSWTAGTGADTHNVYFGTASADVNTATTSSSEFKGNQGGTTYEPGTLDFSATYYWRIDEVNSPETTKGDIWSFTTSAQGGITGVEISCSASGTTVTVSYDVNSLLEVMAFALNVSVDSGAVIESASNFNSDYWLYPGSIDVNQSTEQIDDYGSAVCDGNLPGTLGGIDTNGITIEMAAMYVGQANAPANSGTLFEFTVDQACTVTVTENYVRDGVVMRDGSEITPTLSGCTVY